MAIAVLADANVLYSRTLRDWLFLLRDASAGNMFVVYSTVDIVSEVVYRYRRNNPTVAGDVITRIHDHLVEQIDDRIEEFTIDDTYPGGDLDDRHVHAAAVAAKAGIVLTSDKGFTGLTDPQRDALPYDICTPDEFFVLADDSAPDLVRRVTLSQRDYWATRPASRSLFDQLLACQCPEFAARIHVHLAEERNPR